MRTKFFFLQLSLLLNLLAWASYGAFADCDTELLAPPAVGSDDHRLGETNLPNSIYKAALTTFSQLPSSELAPRLREHLNSNTDVEIKVAMIIGFADALRTLNGHVSEKPLAQIIQQAGPLRFTAKWVPPLFQRSGWWLHQSNGEITLYTRKLKSDREALELVWNIGQVIYHLRTAYSFWPWKYGTHSFLFSKAGSPPSEDPSRQLWPLKLNLPSKFAEGVLSKVARTEERVDALARDLLKLDSDLNIRPPQTDTATRFRYQDLVTPGTSITMGAAMDLVANSFMGQDGHGCLLTSAVMAGIQLLALYSPFDSRCTNSSFASEEVAKPARQRLKVYWYTSNALRTLVLATSLTFATHLPRLYDGAKTFSQHIETTFKVLEKIARTEHRIDYDQAEVLAKALRYQLEYTQEITELQQQIAQHDTPELRRRLRSKERMLNQLIQQHGDLRQSVSR